VWSLLPDGRTLGQAPAPERAALRGAALIDGREQALGAQPALLAQDQRAFELEIELDAQAPPSGPVAIDVLASPDGREFTRLVFDPAAGSVSVDKTRSSAAPQDEGPQLLRASYDAAAFGPMRRLRVFVDGSAIEAFINDAAAYAVRSYPSLSSSTQVRLSAAGRSTTAQVRLWPLQSPMTTRRLQP
jgi:sucrose-6-phosphate hydrolase SacC (GH32 family)